MKSLRTICTQNNKWLRAKNLSKTLFWKHRKTQKSKHIPLSAAVSRVYRILQNRTIHYNNYME